MEALWSHWRQGCAKANTLVQFLLTESHSGGALTVGDFNLHIERHMTARLASSAKFLASCSFRRAQPSSAGWTRHESDPWERAAMGNWGASREPARVSSSLVCL